VSQVRERVESELVRLFDQSLDAFCIAGFDGYLKRVNPAFGNLLGYTEEELLAGPFIELVHPQDVAAVTEALTVLGRGHGLIGFQCRQRRADGTFRWFEWNTRGRPEEGVIYAVGRDVTERHAVSGALDALRRVAVLIAQDVEPHAVFTFVAAEVSRFMDVPVVSIVRYETDSTASEYATFGTEGESWVGRRWSLDGTNVLRLVRASSEAARIDDYSQLAGEIAEEARRVGIHSTVASPIVVAGHVWGAMVASSMEQLPEGTEARLADFTELLAAAIESAESRRALAQLAEEQAALRRVATLVARDASPDDVFGAVVEEVGGLLPVASAAMGRFDPDGMFTTVAAWSRAKPAFPVGMRWAPEGKNVTALVFRTGRPARLDDFSDASGPVGLHAREAGYRSAVGSPIWVEGRLWGVVTAASTAEESLPLDTEARLASFTELVATAIANAESRASVQRLAYEQAALRRVATLVARGAGPEPVFQAVADEVCALLAADLSAIVRFEADGMATLMGTHRARRTPGERIELDPDHVLAAVRDTGRTARFDTGDPAAADLPEPVRSEGVRSGVASPIVVDDALWGAITVASFERSLPSATERRLTDFTELLATAIARTQAREQVTALANEQAALRRVATLVAQGLEPADVFSAVSEEVSRLFGAGAAVLKFEHDPPGVLYVGVSQGIDIPVLTRWELQDGMASAEVYRTGRPARLDKRDWSSDAGPAAAAARRLGIVSTVVSPIVVESRLWGGVAVTSGGELLPLGSEERLEKFTELVATAIANAESRSELAASRMRIVAASDDTRRRIERDLHDGTQQRLVSLALASRVAEARVSADDSDLRAVLSGIASGLTEAVEELRELSRGIHPAILTEGGLGPALHALARRSTIPIEVDIPRVARFPQPIEVAAYFVASEALANAIKHAQASSILVSATLRDGKLRLSIRDDGVGGADPARGFGLVGLADRVEALGGSLCVQSRTGDGTEITAELPLELEPAPEQARA
jgi:PAS domain S-box-containing protein